MSRDGSNRTALLAFDALFHRITDYLDYSEKSALQTLSHVIRTSLLHWLQSILVFDKVSVKYAVVELLARL